MSSIARLLMPFCFFLVPAVEAAEQPSLEPAPYAGPAAGTVITWGDVGSNDNPKSTTIDEPDGMELRYTRENGENVKYYLFCLTCAPPATFDKEEYGKLFPLKVGNSVSFEREWRGTTYRTRMSVLRTERVQTPSGSYDTFVVRRNSERAQGGWRGEATFWYAPEVRWNIRYTFSDIYGRHVDRHVIRISPPSQ